MKNLTVTLPALLITTTVGTAMVHSKAVVTEYCVAYTLESGVPVVYTYDGNPFSPEEITCSLTVAKTEVIDGPFTLYGFTKTPGEPCLDFHGCPRRRFVDQN